MSQPASHLDKSLRATPLHECTAAASEVNLWTEENGFTVAQAYTDIDAECAAHSEAAVLADRSVGAVIQISGADAQAFLLRALMGAIEGLRPGQRERVAWCDDLGWLRGTGELQAISYDVFRLVSETNDLAWFADAALGYTVKIEPQTGRWGTIALAGPEAPALIGLLGIDAAALHADDLKYCEWRGASMRVSGFPARQMFEVWASGEDACVIWTELLRLGQRIGVRPAGHAAWERLRIARGEPKTHVDWLPAQAAAEPAQLRRPQDLGFGLPARLVNGGQSILRTLLEKRPQFAVFDLPPGLGLAAPAQTPDKLPRWTSWIKPQAWDGGTVLGWIEPDSVEPGKWVNFPGLGQAQLRFLPFSQPRSAPEK